MINVAIAYKRSCVRSAFIPYIEKLGPFNISIVASDEEELLRKISGSEQLPDICIFGTGHEDFRGYEITQEIKKLWPSLNVLIFTDASHPYVLMLMKNYGAKGYITWGCGEEELHDAIVSVSGGDTFYQEYLSRLLQNMLKCKKRNTSVLFSENEMKVMRLCSRHLCAKEIAAELNVNKRTVDTYLKRIYTKVGIQTKEQLMTLIFQVGLC